MPLPKYDAVPSPAAIGTFASARDRLRFAAAFPAKRVIWRTAQLRDAGLAWRSIQRLVTAGILIRVRFGCYVRASWWLGLSSEQRRRSRITVHQFSTLTTSPMGFVYSHSSAAALHGLSLWNVPDQIHITQRSKPSGTSVGPLTPEANPDSATKSTRSTTEAKVHTRILAPDEIVEVEGFRTTSLERTVLDCALTLPYQQALILTDHALRLGVSRPALEAKASGMGPARGVRNLRKVLLNANALSESAGETLCRDLMRELRIPAPICQLWIRTRLGDFRADFGWEKEKVVLEFDGKGKYFDYRPTDEAVFQERKRETALMEEGWTVIRVQWAELFQATHFKLRILAALNRAAAR